MNKRKIIIISSIAIVCVIAIVLLFVLFGTNKEKINISIIDSVNGNTLTMSVKKDTLIKDLEILEKDGYKFVSWQDENGNVLDDESVVSPDMTIHAVYDGNDNVLIKQSKMYTFQTKDKDMCNGTHKVKISDSEILTIKEEIINNNNDGNIVGGCFASNYIVTVSGLKAGNASVNVEYYDISEKKIKTEVYYFGVDSDLYVHFERSEIVVEQPTQKTNQPYTFETKDLDMCNGTHNIKVSDSKIISTKEKIISNSSNSNIEGGCFASKYVVTVSGLMKGNSTVTVEYYDISENKVMTDIYYFNVDENLNVNFEKVNSFIEKSAETPQPVTKQTYTFETTESNMCNGTHKTKISNSGILSVKEEIINNNSNGNIVGGCFASNYSVTVSGLKAGNATVSIEYYDISENKVMTSIYYFSVDNNLNVKYEKQEGIIEPPIETPTPTNQTSTFETRDKDMCNGTHKIIVSNSEIISTSEKEIINNNGNIVGGCFATNSSVTVSGLKMGKATVTIEYYDISNNKTMTDIYYYSVDSNLNVVPEKQEGIIEVPKFN